VEPLARMGAQVLGVDAVERSIAAARAHASRDPAVRTRAQYRAVLAEDVLAEGQRFDGVLSLEVVEHCADVPAFTAALAGLVAPGGMLLMSTVNRTLRSYALGVLAAERVLGLVPNGTHDWARFVTPDELAGACIAVCVAGARCLTRAVARCARTLQTGRRAAALGLPAGADGGHGFLAAHAHVALVHGHGGELYRQLDARPGSCARLTR
jgi:2-polyprenyl-3-methyl-5-hydroxy-6-metoxy-1,4-benzoquinol methylase